MHKRQSVNAHVANQQINEPIIICFDTWIFKELFLV